MARPSPPGPASPPRVRVRGRRGASPTRARLNALAFAGVLLSALPVTAGAAPRMDIPPQLRLSAMACLGEALRLCPNALAAKDHGLSCILGKRRLLSAPCRGVYDQGLRVLRGGDLHLRLRPPAAPGAPTKP